MSTSYGPAKPGKGKCVALALVGVVFMCAGGIGVGMLASRPETSGTATSPAKPENTPGESAAKESPTSPGISDGVWTVGVDLPAGRYRTTANVNSRCYWQISRTGGDPVADVISNDIPGGGRPSVTLKVGQDFKTDNCGTWVRR